jgi:protein-S-isoprenylcysteine O-methyltransferase
MLRKLLNGTLISFTFLGVATLGNQSALTHPQLWILAAIGIAAQVFQPLYKPLDRTAPPQDRGTGNHLVWSVYLSQAAGLIESVYFRYPESFEWTAATTAGLVLALAGLALRSWSVYELGRFFTWHIIVQPDHKVVTTGPYRAIRHPGYCGALVLYVFTMVFIHAWISAVLATALVFAAVWRRIRYEEEWLNRHLGEQYLRYSMQVRALIPYVW